jgi:hypothetical protein
MRRRYGHIQQYSGNLYSTYGVPKSIVLPVFHDGVLDCSGDIPIPGRYFLDWPAKAHDRFSWNEKLNTLFWRGSHTGFYGTEMTSTSKNISHRYRLAETSRLFNLNSSSSKYQMDMCLVDLTSGCSRLSMDDHFKHKYLVTVDGWAAADRIYQLLEGESLIFFSSLYENWMMGMWLPWKRNIPVTIDYSDLHDKLQWAADNDEAARKIASASQRLFRDHFQQNHAICYTSLTWIEYSSMSPESWNTSS